MFLLIIFSFFVNTKNFYINLNDNRLKISDLNKIRTKENNYRTFECLVYCSKSLYCNPNSRQENKNFIDKNIFSDKKEIIKNEQKNDDQVLNSTDEQHVENEKSDIKAKKNYKEYITFENFIIVFSFKWLLLHLRYTWFLILGDTVNGITYYLFFYFYLGRLECF